MKNVEQRELTESRGRLPLGVYLLAFSLFAMGSAEFLLAGVLPDIAVDLRISLGAAGWLITAFAIGVVLGAPPLAIATLRWPRRTTLIIAQGVFAAALAIGLLTDSYIVLLATRFVSGVAYAGFWAVAAVTAVGLVAPDRTARASGVVVSGLSFSMIAGGPAGALLSHYTGWRGGFWGVVGCTLLGAVAIAVALPATTAERQSNPRHELATMRRPQLWIVYLTAILSTAAYMVTFNYLAAVLEEITAIPKVWIPAVLALFGIGAFLGLSIGGRIADRHPFRALTIGALGIAAGSILLALFARHATPAIILVALLGISGFILNPALYGRVFTIAADAPTLAGATTVSVIQLGISAVPVLAALAFSAGAPLTAVTWIGAILALLTLAPIVRDHALARRSGAGPERSSVAEPLEALPHS